jgi:hypothetical protein
MDIQSHSWWHRSLFILHLDAILQLIINPVDFILPLPLTEACIQFLDVIVSADDIPDEQKARICKKLGETDKVCPIEVTVLQ